MADNSTYSLFCSLCSMNRIEVTVKEEFAYEDGDKSPPTIVKLEPADAEIKEESFSCVNCSVPVTTEDSLCARCKYQGACTSGEYPCVLESLKSAPNHFLKYSGLFTVQSFVELLKYLEDDLPEIEGCHKSNQLLSVLIKLHFNNGWCYIDKHRFPFVYVKTVNVLHEKLRFLGTKAYSEPVPLFLQSIFRPNCGNFIILDAVSVRVDFRDLKQNLKYMKFVVAYTASGKVFYISKPFSPHVSFKNMVINSDFFRIYDQKNNWIVYRHAEGFVKCRAKNFKVSYMKIVDSAQCYFHEICSRLRLQFQILRYPFPEYCALETNGMNFVQKTLSACSCLLNYKLYTE